VGASGGGTLVTNLVKVAMARKQNFAGVVNEKRTGNTCGVSVESLINLATARGINEKETYRRKLEDEQM